MITAPDLRGVMGMMPAFTTPDGGDILAETTVDVDNLRAGVDRMIGDGINLIATTGSFGEFHTLLPEEFETLARATVEVVNHRVPLFIGCTALNSREVVRKMRVVERVGGEGVLVGVPFYFPSSTENVIQFYCDIAELFPSLAIMVYHNPPLHNVHIPVDAVNKILERPNVVAMKDSHRDPLQFMRLMDICRGRMSVFVAQYQYYAFSKFGAPGCWSIEAWMGPWPLLRLRDAIDRGDEAAAKQITYELSAGMDTGGGPPDLRWRETAQKLAAGFAGYCNPGPLRPPFVNVPEAVVERVQRRAAYWNELCAKYRPQVEALAAV